MGVVVAHPPCTAVLNLAMGIDVDAMEERIATYQRDNYDEILRNEAKKVRILLP